MKYVRWLLLLLLLVCFFEGFRQRPFFREMPMLLLPEQSSDIILKRANYSAYDDVWDPRPICIQTPNNFSCFSQQNHLKTNSIVSHLKSNLSLNAATLSEDKIIATSQKDFSPEVNTVWATKHVRPVPITEPKKQVFIPKK